MKELIFHLDTQNNNIGLVELKKLYPKLINLKFKLSHDIEEKYLKLIESIKEKIDENNPDNVVIFCDGFGTNIAFMLRKYFMSNMNVYIKIIAVNPIFNIDVQYPDNLFSISFKKFLTLDIDVIRDSLIIITDDIVNTENRFVKTNKKILNNNGIVIYNHIKDKIFFTNYSLYININNYINTIV